MTLEEVLENVDLVKVSTLSAFENSRSTNYNHIMIYTNKMTEEQKIEFCNTLCTIL